MPSVVFFISGHGYGHASRQVEVINAVGRRRPDLGLIVRSAVSADLLARTVRVPFELRPDPCDPGIVQRDSVTHDDVATTDAAITYYACFDDHIAQEVTALRHDDVRLIVGDIPPVAFEAALRLGVPSLAVANFTWDWIYESMPEIAARAAWLPARLREAYARATLALALPFTGGFEVFPRMQAIPLIARRATRTRDETRSRFGLARDRRVALLSFGGYGLPTLDRLQLDCLDDWTIITTDRTSAARTHAGIVTLAESEFRDTGFRYEDLVAAADVVITKPGYGIIAECAANGPAMLYTSRGAFREYDVLVAGMPSIIRCQFISQPDLFGGRWAEPLEAVMGQPRPSRPDVSGAEVVAEAVVEWVERAKGRGQRSEGRDEGAEGTKGTLGASAPRRS